MPGTRTAPTVDGIAPSYLAVSVSFIDAVGDPRTVTIQAPAGTAVADIEAYVNALQAASNASIWKVSVQEIYEGVESIANALAAVRESVDDSIVIHYKNALRVSQRVYIPSFLDTLTLVGTENPDVTDALFAAVNLTALDVLGGTYAAKTARVTERREINEAVQVP